MSRPGLAATFFLSVSLAAPLRAEESRTVTDGNTTTVPTTLVDGKPGGYPAFESIEIANAIEIGYAICAADVNGDGKLDVVVADASQLWWFENPAWTRRALTEKGQTRPHNVSIAAADLDGDGKVDFAVGADWRPFDTNAGGDVLWLRRGEDPLKPWTVIPVAHEPTVHRLGVADLDGDGKPEIVHVPLMGKGSTKAKNWRDAPVRVLAYKVPRDPAKDRWPEAVLDDTLHVTHNFDVVRRGKGADVLVASYDGVYLLTREEGGAWSRSRLGEGNQKGAPNPLNKEHPSLGAGEVRMGRLPGGAPYLATVEPWHGHQAVAYVQDKNPDPRAFAWPRHVIDDAGMWGHSVACADIRRGECDDMIVGYGREATDRKKPGVVAYVPLDATGAKWRKHVLEEGVAVEALAIADLNGDGKLDIAVAGRQTKNVKILLQK